MTQPVFRESLEKPRMKASRSPAARELDEHQRQQRDDGHRAGRVADGAAGGAAGEGVAHGEPARVAQGFGQQEHQEHQGQGGAQGEDDAVVAGQGDDAAGAEDGRRGDVVAA